MIRRWNHIHSIATGLVFGLVLDKEALVIFAMGIALGVAVVLSWRFLGRFSRSARDAAALVARKTEAEIERKRAASELDRARAEHRVRTAGEQKRELDRRYFEGARDGGVVERSRSWGWEEDDEQPETILGVPVPVREEAR